MKNIKIRSHRWFIALAFCTLHSALSTAEAQGTAFTYQGRLNTNAVPANGLYDFEFSLSNAPSGGSQIGSRITQTALGVTNGLFTTTLNFGAVFTGNDTWLAISVRSNSVGSYTLMTPLQELTPTPYAMFADTASNVSGTILPAQLPASVVTNNETNVTLGNVTVGGSLTLAEPATMYAGSRLLLRADGSSNFFSGPSAGAATTSGSYNTGISDYALSSNLSGSFNTAIGFEAMIANTNGNYDTAIGCNALLENTTGNGNTATGFEALVYNTIGDFNTASGYAAMTANTTGGGNTATGVEALYANANGNNNAAYGLQALFQNGAGNNNVAVGCTALRDTTNDNNLVAVGFSALYQDNAGSNKFTVSSNGENTAIGYLALYLDTTGAGNTGLGYQAIYVNTNGNGNTALGDSALGALTSGSNNVAVGYQAGLNITTGNNNIYIGNAGVSGDNGVIRIGTTNLQANDTLIAGIWGVTLPGGQGVPVYVDAGGHLGTATSSGRFKQDIQSMANTSEALYSLRPVTFKYKPGIDPKGAPQFGLIAEEVDQVDPDLVVRDDKHQIYTVRYEAVNAMLLNEFLKQHRKVQEQSTEIETLKGKADKVDSLEKQLNELKQMVQSLAARK
jgi:hypothetical protein